MRKLQGRWLWNLFAGTGLALATAVGAAVVADADGDASPFDALEWRNVGPVNMSGRVAAVEGVAGDPSTVYVGAASGGVWKSVDGGLTFAPIFDDQEVASIGAVAVAPSNPEVVYVGTGEGNPRNSVSVGHGVLRSNDGGRSWTHLGLEETQTITRIAVHPDDPDTVYVGALGHIFGPNEERGVYRSIDGGGSWEKVLYLDDRHGVADLDLDPSNPNVLFAAMWHFERKPWTHTSGSEDGGVYRSVDGGTTWKKLDDGLPALVGRIGVKVAPSDPDVVYVIAESNEGTLFRSDDRGDTFRKTTDRVDIVSRGLYYTDLRVDPVDADRVYAIASRLFVSDDGGKTFERISRRTHIDFHSLWIDPHDPSRIWQGQDGGIAVSYDRGETWAPVRNLPLAQLYQVFADSSEPFYRVGGGLQDNGSWIGPSRTRERAGIFPDDWRMFSFGDAYWVVPHPVHRDLFLSEYQGGGILRTDLRSWRQVDVSPQPRRNDGGPVEELDYRFNWNAPIIASPHDPQKVYFAGNVVFETTDFGDTWRAISPDLTTDDPAKQGMAGGPVWPENTTAEYHTTIISLAESPVQAGVLWVGTDDGNLQLTTDSGETWSDVSANVPGMPAHSPVSHVEPSARGAGVAYAAFDRHMFDDLAPHLFRSEDFGATWRRLGGLPERAFIWALREDPKNPDLLYAGTELGLFASWDAGGSWSELDLANLPTVAVHDIVVHPRANDLILGTHGRAIWIFDDATPIQDWNAAVAEADAHLFPPRPAIRHAGSFTRYGRGDRAHTAPNPEYGALITFNLSEKIAEAAAKDDAAAVRIEIVDGSGEVIREIDELPVEAGVQRVAWDLRREPPRQGRDSGPSEFGPGPRGPEVLPGVYTVRLVAGGSTYEQPLTVGVDPTLGVDAPALRESYDVAVELTELESLMGDALRRLDALASQVVARRATLEKLEVELSSELEEALEAYEKEHSELLLLLVRGEDKPYWSQGPRLPDRLGALKGGIEGAFARPTVAQRTLLGELRHEVDEAITAVNVFFADRTAELNAALAAADVPPLKTPPPVDPRPTGE